MISRGMLRGGMIGSMLAVAFSVLGVIPICGFAALPLRAFAYAVGGYFAGRTMVRLGAPGGALAAGMGAGIIAGLIDGIVNIALSPVRFSLAGGTVAGLYLLPEGVIKQFSAVGLDLAAMNTVGGSLFLSAMLCGVIWLFAGTLGAIAGGLAQALSGE